MFWAEPLLTPAISEEPSVEPSCTEKEGFLSGEATGASGALFESSLEASESGVAPEPEPLLEPVPMDESLEPVDELELSASVEPETSLSVLPTELEGEPPAAEPFESEPFEVEPSLVVPPAEPLPSASVEGASILSSLGSSLESSFESGVGEGAGVGSGCTGLLSFAAAASSSAI